MILDVAIVNPVLSSPNIVPELIVEPVRPLSPSELAMINIVELGRSIADLGHRVTVYAADAFLPADEVQLGNRLWIRALHTVLRIPFHPALLPLTPDLAERTGIRDADVIQAGDFHQPTTFFASHAAAAGRVPLILWQEMFQRMRAPASWYQRTYESSLGRAVRARASLFVVRTTRARAHLEEMGVPPSKIGPWIPTGIDAHRFQPEARSHSPEDFGFKPECHLVAIVARLSPDKGIDLAIKAVALLRRTGVDAGLLIRGDGPDRMALQSLAARLGVADRVRFLGRLSREEMVRLYSAVEVVLCPSRRDLAPFVLLEGAACGKPSVCTRVGALEDFVQDGVTGIIVEPNSVHAIADALRRLLGDAELRDAMGRAARRRIEETFDIEQIARRFEDVYEGAVQDRT